MIADVKVFEWSETRCQWAGWWQGDEEVPEEFEGVELRQLDNSNIYVGKTMVFDLPDGEYSDGSQHVHRWVMEAMSIDFWSGTFTLEGFVHVETFDEGVGTPPPFEGYHKQRWVVRA